MTTNAFDRMTRRLAPALAGTASRRAALVGVVAGLAGTEAADGRRKKKPKPKRCPKGRVKFAGQCLLPCVDAAQCPDDPFTTWCWPTFEGTRRFCTDLGANLNDVCDLEYRRCSSQGDCRKGQVCLSTACLSRCMDVV